MERAIEAYLKIALATTLAQNGRKFSDEFSINDVSSELKDKTQRDLDDFANRAGNLVKGISKEKNGEFLWLARNRHDSGIDEDQLKNTLLIEIARSFGEIHLVLGKDGQIYSA